MRAYICIFALLAVPLHAAAAPFSKADPAAGEKLYVAAACSKCHSDRVGGDGTRMYTRPEHRVTNPSKLLAQVRMCNTQLNTGWFPEDEEDVAAFLNRKFYKFK